MNEKVMRFEFQVNLKKVWYKRKTIKVPNTKELNLRSCLLLAHQMQHHVEIGKAKALVDFCKWINISHSRICQILKLLLLAPNIQTEIILKDSERIASLTERSIRKIPMQLDWKTQCILWNTMRTNHK